jgi:tRNA pseudouridine38-40 synthase
MPRRVRIDLAYDGTAYAGWQWQPRQATVQGVLEAALTRLHGGGLVRVRGAGRTDAGVHARGQVADAMVDDRFSDRTLFTSLLALLPGDVRVHRVVTVDGAFHARHDAVAKTYAYSLDRTLAGDPFLARFALHEPRPLDEDAIDAALSWLPGTRDWSGFAGGACTVRDRVRTMTVARRALVRPGLDVLEFTADGFLTHMVRNLVGTLLDVGRGRLDPGRLAVIVAAGDRTLAGATAPPHGLCLLRVDYGAAAGGNAPDGPTPPIW